MTRSRTARARGDQLVLADRVGQDRRDRDARRVGRPRSSASRPSRPPPTRRPNGMAGASSASRWTSSLPLERAGVAAAERTVDPQRHGIEAPGVWSSRLSAGDLVVSVTGVTSSSASVTGGFGQAGRVEGDGSRRADVTRGELADLQVLLADGDVGREHEEERRGDDRDDDQRATECVLADAVALLGQGAGDEHGLGLAQQAAHDLAHDAVRRHGPSSGARPGP